MSGPTPRLASGLATLAVGVALGVAALLALFSLRWPLVHDLPIFLYDGYLILDVGRVPYRDLFEINPPGTLLLYALLHALTHGADLALRAVDLGLLAVLCGLTLRALRSHGLRAGLLASGCFAITYLAEGPVHALQREYLCLLPLALAIALAFRMPAPPRRAWPALAGLGLSAGVAMSIKPAMVVCWAPLFALAAAARVDTTARHRGARVIAGQAAAAIVPVALGLVAPVAAAFAWLAWLGALDDYLDIARNYYPLYQELSGTGATWQSLGLGTLGTLVHRYVSDTLRVFSDFRFLALSFVGVALAWGYRARPAFVQCLVLCGVAAAALLYVPLVGKFWVYHTLPLAYALSLLAGLGLSRALERPAGEAAWHHAILCLAVAVGVPFNALGHAFVDWRSGASEPVKEGRVDLVTRYLDEHSDPSESVMPLDVTGGAVHALYRARRPMYGRFVYDHVFYHHVEHPYIQALRRELLAQLDDPGPDLVVRFDDTWLRVPNFPELDAQLARDYEVVLQENDVSILRRRAEPEK